MSDAFAAWLAQWHTITWAFVMPYLVVFAFELKMPRVGQPFNQATLSSGLILLYPVLLILYMAFMMITYYGQFLCSLRAIRGEHVGMWTVFSGRNSAFRFFLGMLMMMLFLVFGFVLLIVPGVIVLLTFFLFPFVMVDMEKMPILKIFNESERLMKGFRLDLLGLIILFMLPAIVLQVVAIFAPIDKADSFHVTLVSLAVGLVLNMFVQPWAMISYARFYAELKSRDILEEPLTETIYDEKESSI